MFVIIKDSQQSMAAEAVQQPVAQAVQQPSALDKQASDHFINETKSW